MKRRLFGFQGSAPLLLLLLRYYYADTEGADCCGLADFGTNFQIEWQVQRDQWRVSAEQSQIDSAGSSNRVPCWWVSPLSLAASDRLATRSRFLEHQPWAKECQTRPINCTQQVA
jgi:hypothetical protein